MKGRPVSMRCNAGDEALEWTQQEDGVPTPYRLDPGEARAVPLPDDELETWKADQLTPAELVEAEAPLGVIGWTCRVTVGAICTHPACMPDFLATAIDSPA